MRSAAVAGTTVRLAVLVVLALSVSGLAFLASDPVLGDYPDALARCQARPGVLDEAEGRSLPETLALGQEHSRLLQACLTASRLDGSAWLIVGLAVLLAAVAVFYLLQPMWKIRRQRLVPSPATPGSALAVELDALVARAGLRRKPVFLLDPCAPRTGGLAFGRGTRPYVRLDAGLIAVARTNPGMFRSVVLHELAHLRDRDVPLAYMTMATWRAFLLVTPLLVVVSAVRPDLFGYPPQSGWTTALIPDALLLLVRLSALIGLVYLSRNAVLRAREYQADQRVTQWLGTVDYLTSPSPRRRSWRAWFTPHPTVNARLAAVADPTRLARPGFGEALAFGVAMQLAWLHGALLVAGIGGFAPWTTSVMELVWGSVLAVFVMVQAARVATLSRVSWRDAMTPSAGLVVGLAVGGQLIQGSGVRWPDGATLVVFAGLGIAVTCLLRWAAGCFMLAAARPTRGPRAIGRVAVAATVTLVCVMLSPLSSAAAVAKVLPVLIEQAASGARGLVEQVDGSWLERLLSDVVANPVVLMVTGPAVFAVVLLCCLPLLLRFPTDDRVVRSALWAGLCALPAALALLVALRVVLHAALAPEVLALPAYGWVLSVWSITALLTVQFIVAVVQGTRRRPLAVAVTSALIAGLAGTASLWLLNFTGSCMPALTVLPSTCPGSLDATYEATILRIVTLEGTVLAVLGALLGTKLAIALAAIPAATPHIAGRGGRIGVTVIVVAFAAILLLLT